MNIEGTSDKYVYFKLFDVIHGATIPPQHSQLCVIVYRCSPFKCSSCAKEGILQDWQYFYWFVKSVRATSTKASSLKSVMSAAHPCEFQENHKFLKT